MLRISTGARNAILDTGLNNAFDTSGRILIYSGAQPTTADTLPSGTLLCTITLPADIFTVAASGTISKQGTWSGTAATAGTAGYARLQLAADLGTTNTTDKRIDGTVATTAADFIIDNSTVVAGATITVSTFSFTLPAQ